MAESKHIQYTTCHQSPLGEILLVANKTHLLALWLEGQKYADLPESLAPGTADNHPVLQATKTWLDAYFAGKKPEPSILPLDPQGSEFRRTVWQILKNIPYGETRTYGEIAREIEAKTKKPMASQAVGGAVGHNPISIIIPCHRVVGAKGNLTGYGGGIATKIKLLEHEGVDLTKFFVPDKGTAL